MMKKTIVVGSMILALVLSGCGIGAKEPTPTPLPDQAFAQVVSITGELAPARWTTISARMGGTAIEVLVEPGDKVAAGDSLIQIDPTDAELAVRRAEIALETAQARLALLQSHPQPEDVAVAEAQVESARAALSQAAAQRDQLLAGATEAEIIAARSQAMSAQADELAAREHHDDTMKCYKFTLPDGTKKEICPLLGPVEEQTRYRMQAADEEADAAQARLDALVKGEADRIRAVEATVWAAAEQVDTAKAQLASMKAGASREEIDAVKASIQQAEAGLAEARVILERTEVQAPFAGTVGVVQIHEGEFIAPGQPVITLGDLSTLRVETTDLDEIDVARVEVGQTADITFDALPDRVFKGTVTRINPMAESDGGGVNYTAIIELDELDPAIRWGMTAFVDVLVEQ